MIGCGIVIIGAGIGIGLIGSRAADSIARQPEAGSRIFTAMIVAAALIEGVTFFALLVCFLGLSGCAPRRFLWQRLYYCGAVAVVLLSCGVLRAEEGA